MILPSRHRNHEIEELSERFFKNNIPPSWIINKFHIDYGTDYNCEISLDKKVTGINFTVQLKGKETDSKHYYITIDKIKRSTINRWLNRLEPTMIIVYIVDENEAYWCWFEKNKVDLSEPKQNFRIKISRENKISKINWDSIVNYLEKVFSRKNLLYELPDKDTNENVWNLFFNKEFNKALPKFKELTKTYNKGDIWNALSICHYELFHYQDALIAINKAIELHKDNMLLLNKAAILTEQGILYNDKIKLKQAKELYQNLIETGEDSAELHYNYANALNNLGEYEESIKEFIISLEINPNYAEAWKNLGSVYYKFGDHEKEINCYDKALTIKPKLQEALFSKGNTLFFVFKKFDKGLELMIESTKISNRFEYHFPYVYFWIAEAYLGLKKYNFAIQWNKKGLKNNPSDKYLLKQKERIEKNKNTS
ncbi:MAG: tetratricopeptide repeat protein [Candidatus Woesearchaeota archaeon]